MIYGMYVSIAHVQSTNGNMSFVSMNSVQESTLAQDGDARYLAFEVLSGTVSTAADVFSLGLAAFELLADYDMPVTGDVWTHIRQMNLPDEILTFLTDLNLKMLLLKMIDSDYKQRPTAKDILDHPMIRNEVRR
jgi:serine/threonine protein kinase